MSVAGVEELKVISGASGITRAIPLRDATNGVLNTVQGRVSPDFTPALCNAKLIEITTTERVGGFAEALTTHWALQAFPTQQKTPEINPSTQKALRAQRPSQETIKTAFRVGTIIFRGAIMLHRGIQSANLGRR